MAGMAKKKTGYFCLMWKMSGIACRRVPTAFFLMVLCTVVSGLLQSAGVWFKQQLFDGAEAFAGGGRAREVFAAGIALGLCLAVQLVVKAASRISEMNFAFEMQREAGSLLNRKAAKIEAIFFEDNRFLDHIEKAGRGMEAAANIFIISLEMLLLILSYFGFMGIYLFQMELGLLIMLMVSFLPYIAGAAVRYQVHKNTENLAAPYRRRGESYASCITGRGYVKETRLLGVNNYFFRKFTESIQMVKLLSWKTVKKSELADICLRFLSMAGYIGMAVLLFYYFLSGRISVGAFAAVLSSLDNMSDTLERIFNFNVNEITSSMGAAENYLTFLSLPECGEGGSVPEGKNVEFRNVTFSYPEASENAIENLSMVIREGETVAIVGSNGAGKSTLVRLLTGIYKPLEGSVLIDGIDTREFNPSASSGHISAVFQKYQKYQMKVRENVLLGDSKYEEEAGIEEALAKAELDCTGKAFPQGKDTLLSKEFGGTDLSGGQWQRLAIARGFYRRHNLIVLDEPTAAIDPLEESAIYRKFVELAQGKTAVVVTHRLGAARIAERIIVMDHGRIAEMGGHSELIEKKGLYYEMYQEQAKWYLR